MNVINNNNLWNNIFSAPMNNNNINQNQNLNNQNNNAFNLIPQNQPQQQPQQQNMNLGGFDFTNKNIPENKERIEKKNRFDKLENALNSLNLIHKTYP